MRSGLQPCPSFFPTSVGAFNLLFFGTGEIGGPFASGGKIDRKTGQKLLSASRRIRPVLMGIKGALEWKSLDNVSNFFQEADDSNLLSHLQD